jgi:hypothetical protein
MTNSQNPERAESTAGWVPVPKRPARGKYLLVGLEVAEPLAAATKPLQGEPDCLIFSSRDTHDRPPTTTDTHHDH